MYRRAPHSGVEMAFEKRKTVNAVGIMNGTSLDGVDFVYVTMTRSPFSMKYKSMSSLPFPKTLQRELTLAVQGDLKVPSLADVSYELGRFYAKSLRQIVDRYRWKPHMIALHGQTVFHAPPRATLQIGEPAFLKKEFSIPIVSHFRPLAVAHGGEGAPLATLFHREVLRQKLKKYKRVAIQNIGGMANVSYFDHAKRVIFFDTGPGNILIDMAVQHFSKGKKRFDDRGLMASSGIASQRVVQTLLKGKYFQKKPPKSCGRELFGPAYFRQSLGLLKGHLQSDKVATYTELTAQSLILSYKKYLPHLPEVIVLCGGGARNETLKSHLNYGLPHCKVLTTEDIGWPAQSVEGAAFALLGAYRLWNKVNGLKAACGGKTAVLGQVF